MMNPRKYKDAWIIRVLTKWIWLLGFLPLGLDYASSYIPQEYIPQFIKDLLVSGARLNLTILLLTVGLLVSAYLVHRESDSQIANLSSSVDKFRNEMPQIKIGLTSLSSDPSRVLILNVSPNPAPPDFDALVEKKRVELYSKAPGHAPSNAPDMMKSVARFAALSAFNEPNPNYLREVDEYLDAYRKHLVIEYELTLDRAFEIQPVITNVGTSAASTVTVEFHMHNEYEPPQAHQSFSRKNPDDIRFRIAKLRPKKPKPYKNLLEDRFEVPYLGSSFDRELNDLHLDTFGPSFEQRDGFWIITYDIEKLIPKLPYDELDPFLIWVGSIVESCRWDINAKIYSEQIHEPQDFELSIQFQLEES